MSPSLQDIALFIEVARLGSFSRAAERLELPVSSLSRRIARLEREVGLRLLHRTTRRVVTTEAGQAYFDRCEGLVDEVRDAHLDLLDRVTVPRGRLRVSMTGGYGTQLFSRHLVAFGRRYPDVALDLDLTARRVDLLGERVDVALRFGPLEDSTLVARHLAWIRIALFASPDYLAARAAPRTPRDLARHACLRLSNREPDGTWTLVKGLRREEVAVDGPFAANSMAMLHQLTLADCGIGALDAALAAEDVERGRLKPVLPGWAFDRVPIHALTPSRLMPAKTRAFIAFVAERLNATERPATGAARRTR